MPLSPSVTVKEVNKSTVRKSQSGSVTVFCGHFEKGPIDYPLFITNLYELTTFFGEGINEFENDWYQVYNFLKYSSGIYVVRSSSVRNNASNASVGFSPNIVIDNQDSWNTQVGSIPTFGAINAVNGIRFIAKTPGAHGNNLVICVITQTEYTANVILHNGITAQNAFTFFEPGYMGIAVFDNKLLVETFNCLPQDIDLTINSHTSLLVKNNPSNFIYAVPDASLNNTSNLALYTAYNNTSINLVNGYSTVPTHNNLSDSYSIFENKDSYAIDIIIGNERANDIAINLAELRRDCIAYIGIPTRISTLLQLVIAGQPNQVLTINSGALRIATLNLSNRLNAKTDKVITDYVNTLTRSIFANFTLNVRRVTNIITGRPISVNIAGDAAGLKAIAGRTEPWLTGAGSTRGQIKRDIKGASTYINFTKAQKDRYYILGLNCTEKDVIISEKTFSLVQDSYSSTGVRCLVNHIERGIQNVLWNSLFDGITSSTFNNISSNVNMFLESVRIARGIQALNIQITQGKPNEIIVYVQIKPTYTINFINLRVSSII